MAEEAPAPSGDLASVVEIQATAKWLIATLGAIAAVIVAGLSFGSFGTLEIGRAIAAIVGTLAAMGGVLWLLIGTLNVMVVVPASLASLAELPDDALDQTVISPADTPKQLSERVPSLIAATEQAYEKHLDHPTDLKLRGAFLEAKNRRDQWLHAARKAIDRRRLVEVQNAFKDTKARLPLKVGLVLVGVGVAAWGLTGPAQTSLSISAVTQTPTEVVVEFQRVDFGDKPVPQYAVTLGERCVNADVAHAATAVAVEGQDFTLAMMKSDRCPTALVTVGPDEAAVALPPEE